jgi:hypothetical protein
VISWIQSLLSNSNLYRYAEVFATKRKQFDMKAGLYKLSSVYPPTA